MFRRTVTTRIALVASAAAVALAGTATAAVTAQAATLPPLDTSTRSLIDASLFKANLKASQSAGVVTIKNTGVISTGAFTIGTWRSDTKLPTVQARIANLAPGASVHLSPGTEGGVVRADIYNEVPETNETDNAVYARLQS